MHLQSINVLCTEQRQSLIDKAWTVHQTRKEPPTAYERLCMIVNELQLSVLQVSKGGAALMDIQPMLFSSAQIK